MSPDKQKELKLKYANFFGTGQTPFNCWGFETEDGWNNLIENLLAELNEYTSKNNINLTILQIKSKFASLRFHTGALECQDSQYKDICKIISKYEELSRKTCEITGKPGQLSERNGWLKTLSIDKARELGYTPINE